MYGKSLTRRVTACYPRQMSTILKTSSVVSGRNLLLLAVWAVGLFGVLQVHQLEGWFGHAICGPWGCGPPVSALIGYHGFWLLLMVLPAWWLKHCWADATLQRLGTGLLLVAAVGIVMLLAVDGWQTWQREAMRPYLVQWSFFRLATFVDFPLVQLGLIGLWLRNSQRNSQQASNTPANSTQANNTQEIGDNDNSRRISEA